MPTAWLEAGDVTAATELRWRPDFSVVPAGNVLVGDAQFRVLVRKTPGAPHPLITMTLEEETAEDVFTSIRTLQLDVEVTSTSGQIVEGDWNISEVSDWTKSVCHLVSSPGEGFT